MNNNETFGLLTAEQTRERYPVGTVVRFAGYEDEVGPKTGTFARGNLLEVVGHSDATGPDGLLVRRYYHGNSGRRGRTVGLIFVTETAWTVEVDR